MAIDYKKLEETAKLAFDKGAEAAKGEDMGTCNLDSTFLVIPRANEEKTITALKAGGLSANKTSWMRTTGYMIYPPKCGQGDSRVRACRAVEQTFKNAGYEVFSYEQMD